MIACRVIFTILLLATLCSSLIGCASLAYYSQSIAGQTEIIVKQKPITDILDQEVLAEKTRKHLQLVQELRRFSIEKLGLPDNDSYQNYADLERPYVVWTIFATEEFSLTPKSWCFLIVGCLHYRGFFSEQDARQEKTRLEEAGYDVFMGGVAAYSTLGWFDDPVLNTMLNWSETYLARVIFHELAHQQLYVKNDTAFNESYADTVALIGVKKWLEYKENHTQLEEFLAQEAREATFVALVMRYKLKLETLYASKLDSMAMRDSKQALYAEMKNEYLDIKKLWPTGSYDNWFNNNLNNARMASVVSYRSYVDDMLDIYAKSQKKLSFFYDIIYTISQCGADQRQILLNNRAVSPEC